MDATSLLTEDHEKVRALFKSVEKLGPRADRARADLFARIDQELTVHAKIEEKIFYPAFKKKAKDGEQRDEVMEAFEEHAVAKRLIRELEGLEPDNERYKAKLTVLIEAVKHHADEEEKEMFPMARKLFKRNELDDLGQELAAEKERLGARRPKARTRA